MYFASYAFKLPRLCESAAPLYGLNLNFRNDLSLHRAPRIHSVTLWGLTTHSCSTNSWRTRIITCAGLSDCCHRSILIWLQRPLAILPVGTSCRPRRPNGSKAPRVNLCSVSVLQPHLAAAGNSSYCMLSERGVGDGFGAKIHFRASPPHE